MRFLFFFVLALAFVALLRKIWTGLRAPGLPVAEVARRVASGQALLIDIREPAEWSAGVAAPAYLAPLSDLQGSRRKWRLVLEDLGSREALLYCASGTRSAHAARLLRREGHSARNVGSYRAWRRAGLPTRGPDDPASLA